MAQQEVIEYKDTSVPIYRAQFDEIFMALQPPDAQPYIMCPRAAEPQQIIDFFGAHANRMEELQADMKKRFSKGKSLQCQYKTGDVAYVMGRPFMLRVNPLGTKKVSKTMRGRTTSKFSVDTEISLLTLYVMHTGSYDEVKLAFNGYAERIVLKNAEMLARQCWERIGQTNSTPSVRMRSMRGRFTSFDAGCLWLSQDIIPYPLDCLAYVVWRTLMDQVEMDKAQQDQILDGVLDWRNAARILSNKEKPYSNQ